MKPKVHVLSLNHYIKKVAVLSVKDRLDEVVDEKLLYSLIGAAIESSKLDNNIIGELKKIDLTRVIKGANGLNQSFKCSIFAERSAWIYKDDSGHYRYYSRRNNSIYSFDIIDLLSIFQNKKKKEVFDFIQNRWHIKGINAWYLEQREKMDLNQWVLHEIQQDSKQYPYLNKLIKKKHWKVLEKMNEFAFEKIGSSDKAVDEEVVFFLSNNYLRETYFPKNSISTINNLVNLFCVLGFVKKIPLEKLPKVLSSKAEIHFKKKGVQNYTSYYQMMNFQNICKEAEKRAEKLIESQLYYHRLSKNKIIELFGESFANEIYVQTTFGHKGKLEPIYVKGQNTFYTESERLEAKFLQSLKNTGRCSKSELANTSLLSRSKFSIVWKNLIQKYHCQEKYPKKEEFEKYKMEKRLLIAVPTEKSCIP